MDKIIYLGSEFTVTGEPRVRVLDQQLVKTASSGIQKIWDGLGENPDYAYLWVIGVSAHEFYGCNNNGDAFTEAELKKNHPTFVNNAHVFLHHVNKDPKKSIGKPIFSFYNDTMHRVELILQIDKRKPMSKDVLRKIKNGEDIGVSMGCRVKYDVCSICGHQAKTRSEYCDHTRYNMKSILPDGRQVFVFNPDPQFFDISVVNKPADPIALSLDKIASAPEDKFAGFSADYGEASELYTHKIAALDKLSDIIKQVNGVVTDAKDDGQDVNVLSKIDPEKLDYPVLGFEDLEKLDASPGCILHAIAQHGAPPSLGEIAYAFGKQQFGNELTRNHVSDIFSMIPSAIRILRTQDAPLERIGFPILMQGIEGGIPESIVRQVAPVAQTRILIIKQAAEKEYLDKFARDTLEELPLGYSKTPPPQVRGGSISKKFRNMAELRATKGPGFHEQYTVTGEDGNQYQASRRAILVADEQNATFRAIRKLFGAALGTAALGAFLSEPKLVQKLVTATGLGVGAASLWNTQPTQTVLTEEGYEVPTNTLFTEKTANTAAAAAARQFARENLGTLVGLSIPATLGLDYLYNKKLKYKGARYPEQYMGKKQRAAYRAGEAVTGNPFSALLAGGIAGAGGAEGLRLAVAKLKGLR